MMIGEWWWYDGVPCWESVVALHTHKWEKEAKVKATPIERGKWVRVSKRNGTELNGKESKLYNIDLSKSATPKRVKW